jgi:intracellular septation protein A
MLKLNTKIFLSSVITFIFLLISFLYLNSYMHQINFEFQYRNYLEEEKQNEFNLIDYEAKDYKVLNFSKHFLIIMSITFILILNHLYYINKSLNKSDTQSPTTKQQL